MSTRQVREPGELLRAHGLTAALDGPDDFIELADELHATAGRVCAELVAAMAQPLSVQLSWAGWQVREQEDR